MAARRHWRFLVPHAHLNSVFGDDWFALKAEAFARFFGTPTFLIAQTAIVLVWMGINLSGWTTFDVYPFILLNLAFSLQAKPCVFRMTLGITGECPILAAFLGEKSGE
ncbi:DUF1003 domain-containing protein [Rhodoblastus sp.]|uniref:DUF1003 domain-containing protein n=1 Tax=Rhodoblastus sp. TaxID=1962975 RepID=UPI00314550B1